MNESMISHPENAKNIAQASGSSFLYSFLFLPKEKREAIRTVYAFARRLDDSVDEEPDTIRQQALLKHFREEIACCYSKDRPEEPLMQELSYTIDRFSIPREPFEELIRGCEMDIDHLTYPTFEDLRKYCYRVASCVGLICLPIFGCNDSGSQSYAIHLGLALQLTNILRDVGSDADRGRIYIPLEDLKAFHYSPEELKNKIYNPSFRQLMAFEAGKALEFYHQAADSLPRQNRKKLIAARMMGRIYYALLHEIIRRDYQVYPSKISLSKPKKIQLALLTYLGIGY